MFWNAVPTLQLKRRVRELRMRIPTTRGFIGRLIGATFLELVRVPLESRYLGCRVDGLPVEKLSLTTVIIIGIPKETKRTWGASRVTNLAILLGWTTTMSTRLKSASNAITTHSILL